MTEPKIRFELDEELREYARYWIDVLMLDHWSIVVRLVPPSEISGCQGMSDQVSYQENALVRIADTVDFECSYVCKICQEQTLVHELLHLKYSYLEPSDDREGQELYYNEHKLIEQMSKSLLMARYGISLDWFKKSLDSQKKPVVH